MEKDSSHPFERKTLTTACIDSQSCWEIATSFLLRKLLAFIFFRKRNPICRDTTELWEQGRWERAQAQGALFIAFSLVHLRRSCEEEAFGSAGVMWLIFLLRPYLILPSGRSVQKNNKENYCKEAAGLSCCRDNGGVIGNHLCKLRCPLKGACWKCGHSFSRPIFFLLQNNPEVFLFGAIEEEGCAGQE